MIRLFLGVMMIAGVALGLAIGVGVFWGMLIVGMGTARAHGAAHWIAENPRYVDAAGLHCCGISDCRRPSARGIRF